MHSASWSIKYNTGHSEMDLCHYEMMYCLGAVNRAISGGVNYGLAGRLLDDFNDLCSIHAQVEHWFFVEHDHEFDHNIIDALVLMLDSAIQGKAGADAMMEILDQISVVLVADILTDKVETAHHDYDTSGDGLSLWMIPAERRHEMA